ncbi:hypothetical protein [Thiorhodococcus minor]|uniref:Uncharacterized protein n=1 Tax=Thiorhodococcus minor TaxID=57489 RepID=A0A6M0JXS7_9GAMM|nr:hypothetical protein [Thiorhodococcus minor]NEV61844.1 hypothetical protein [Thiorhodococcus minor]
MSAKRLLGRLRGRVDSVSLIAVVVVIALGTVLPLFGCAKRIHGYLPALEISHGGFARDEQAVREAIGHVVKVLGFVDHGNLYGNADVRAILGDWWSGEAPSATTWRFNLKSRATDRAGESFAVLAPNDAGRDRLLRVFLADAVAGRQTCVLLRGRLFAFEAPMNLGSRVGLRLEVASSEDISVAEDAGRR